jgi:hypothetical protein
MLGPLYLIEMVAQAMVNAIPNQLAQTCAAREIVDQISTRMVSYYDLQVLSSEQISTDADAQPLVLVTGIMEDLARKLRTTLVDSAIKRRADAHLVAMKDMLTGRLAQAETDHTVELAKLRGDRDDANLRVQELTDDLARVHDDDALAEGLRQELQEANDKFDASKAACTIAKDKPELKHLTEEQRNTFARVWAMGVDEARDDADSARRTVTQRFERVTRQAKAHASDTWRHWQLAQARVLAVVAAFTVFPAALALPSSLLIRRIELNADFGVGLRSLGEFCKRLVSNPNFMCRSAYNVSKLVHSTHNT